MRVAARGTRMRIAGLALAGLALVGAGGARAQGAPAKDGRSRVEKGKTSAVLLPVADDPTITYGLWFRVGSQDDPPGKEGLAYLTGQMLAEAGTRKNSYDAIQKRLYPLASSYGIRVDKEMTTFGGRTHRDNAPRFYDLFADAFQQPAFDAADFERLKSDQLNYLEKTLRYASDEELAKAALNSFVFAGTTYDHPPEGTVEGLRSITLDDVKSFYERYYTRENAVTALGGGYSDAQLRQFESALRELPAGRPPAPEPPGPPPIRGKQVLLISKPRAYATICFGYPIDVHRGERDFYALWIANSWLGEHRNSSSHLYQVIREARGLNYGDYSYIEVFPSAGSRRVPPTGVGRRQQIFEVWIRTLPNEKAHFALRAGMRELKRLVDQGMTQEQFDLTRSFLEKHALHFAETTSSRLGYAVDDRFYGLDSSHLQRFRQMMGSLTLADVNAAIERHLNVENVKIAIVTGEADSLMRALVSDAPSPIKYESEKPAAILAEDLEIGTFPLGIRAADVRIVPVERIFQK